MFVRTNITFITITHSSDSQLFMSALFSFLLYSLVFLSFSGYISVVGWRIRVHLKPDGNGRSGRADNEVIKIAKLMLL